MAKKVENITYVFTTIAGACFIAGLLVLSGGDTSHGEDRGYIVYTDRHA